MKLFAKVMIALLVIGILLPFTILKGNDGDTLMSFSNFSLPDISLPDWNRPKSSSSESIAVSAPDNDLSGKDIFYKWYDADGNLQFTSELPADGVEYTIKGYDPDANVIQAVKARPKETTAKKATPDQNENVNPDQSVNPYSPESIKNLLDDTKNIEKLLNQRLQGQNAAINQ